MRNGRENPAENAGAECVVRKAAIRCSAVVLVYKNGTRANDGIDLEVHEGSIVCLLGGNGAGKTTLIRQLSGEIMPTSGSIELLGMPPAKAQGNVGLIPQEIGLFEDLTVADHLRFFGPLKGLSAVETREASSWVVRECGLEQIVTQRAGSLSGGQKRLVLLALTLLAKPRLLLLDEPTTGLDPEIRRRVWNIIRARRDAGAAILLTTHYLDEAEALADRVCFLKAGRVVRLATLDELYDEMEGSVRLRVRAMADGGAISEQTHYFNSFPEAQAFAATLGLQSYSVGRISLEDVYLRFVGQDLREGA